MIYTSTVWVWSPHPIHAICDVCHKSSSMVNLGILLSHDKWFVPQIDSVKSSQIVLFKTGDSISAICTNCNVISVKINCYSLALNTNLSGGPPSIIGFNNKY